MSKTVVITGGNTGIGRQIALEFAKEQANIVINYLFNEELADSLIEEVKELGGSAIKVLGDVTKMEDCKNILAASKEAFGKVDVLVNNSGITRDNLILRMKEEDFDAVISVNLKGVWNMCKTFAKHMTKNKSGSIINMSSVVGIMGNAGQSNYVASKSGVIGITKSLAKEFGSRGVTVNAIAPGFIKTAMTDKLPEEVVNNYLTQIPLRRLGDPVEIAYATTFLASDKARYITGQVLSVNGGMV